EKVSFKGYQSRRPFSSGTEIGTPPVPGVSPCVVGIGRIKLGIIRNCTNLKLERAVPCPKAGRIGLVSRLSGKRFQKRPAANREIMQLSGGNIAGVLNDGVENEHPVTELSFFRAVDPLQIHGSPLYSDVDVIRYFGNIGLS